MFAILMLLLLVWAVVASVREVLVDGRRRVPTAHIVRPAGTRR